MAGKASKLREKPARMPLLHEWPNRSKLQQYKRDVVLLNTEPARSHRFTTLLKDLFEEVEPQLITDYLRGLETRVTAKQGDLVVRGSIDALYGNLVIEFERDLKRNLPEADNQLKKYVACLWAKAEDQKRQYLCLATDGLKFYVYSPRIEGLVEGMPSPEQIQLAEVEKVDLADLKEDDAYFWLDRHFLRKMVLAATTELFVRDFGVTSPAFLFSLSRLEQAWHQVRSRPDSVTIYGTWEKYLRITYGSFLGGEELFLKHTYLANLGKLIAFVKISGAEAPGSEGEITEILDGGYFRRRHAITNFLEEDFFSWIIREPVRQIGLEIARKLIHQLARYYLRDLSEDILKGLYQELVDPKDRHDLGEYYTPDWLAQMMVERTLKKNPRAYVLDPACGSGTFLYTVVRHKRKALGDSRETLEHILESICGIEIHPLAVIIAKTNYLLALGDLIKKGRGKKTIPIYLADSLKLPQERLADIEAPVPSYEEELDGKTVLVPRQIVEGPPLYDRVIDLCQDFAQSSAGKGGNPMEAFLGLLKQRLPRLAGDEKLTQALYHLASVMREFQEEGRDTIWGYVLKNLFKPLYLKEKFDLVIGNPPWLSYRYVDKGRYQEFLKKQITEEYDLLKGRGELITHMELATLFFLRAADLYLKWGTGTIAFVLPRSIFSSDQHDAFRQRSYSKELSLTELWDLEKVKPLFNVPACVAFATRKGKTRYPIKSLVLTGRLPKKNAKIEDASVALSEQETELSLHRRGKRTFLAPGPVAAPTKASPYKKLFKEGATIVPRPFWFVEVKPHPTLGFDADAPYVETSQAAQDTAKPAYKGLKFEGNIEKQFLYAILLSTDLVPFGHLDFRLVVLPLEPMASRYAILGASAARQRGYLHLAQWLEQAQREWETRRGEKAQRMDVYGWLDYRRKLTDQDPSARYLVVYPMSATYLCASLIETMSLHIPIGDYVFEAQGFLADYVLFYGATKTRKEAYYLSAILNSAVCDNLIKPMQSRGLFGPRHICKKVWELPLAQYDNGDARHQTLASLGEACTARVKKVLAQELKSRSIGQLRSKIREALKDELTEIDALVKKLLGL